MRLLLVAATELELAPLLARLTPAPHRASSERLRAFTYGSHQVDVLITGVGMVATALWCGRVLARHTYDLAVNLGLCGSFSPAYPPGAVVNVLSDCLPELGAEDGDQFLTVHQLGLLGLNEAPFHGGRLVNPAPGAHSVVASLPGVSAITVNTVHGNVLSIDRIVERCHPDIESMEGAAFMYAELVGGGTFAQVRAVSNVVERRNRNTWRVPEAVEALTDAALRIIEQA